jgi:hypothetical protein
MVTDNPTLDEKEEFESQEAEKKQRSRCEYSIFLKEKRLFYWINPTATGTI